MRRNVAALTLIVLAGGLVRAQVPPESLSSRQNQDYSFIPGKPPVTLSSRLKQDYSIMDRLGPTRSLFEERVKPTPQSLPVSRFAQPGTEEPCDQMISFDPNAVELRRKDGRWQLAARGALVKDFGPGEAIARQALKLIRDLGLSQRGLIGRPRPIMEYWLAAGKPPEAGTPLPNLIGFNLSSLKVEMFQGQWCVRDKDQVLMAFGSFEADAQRALEVLQEHRFNKLGMIGRGPEGLMFFVSVPVAMEVPPAEAKTDPNTRKPRVGIARINPRQMALAGDLMPATGIPGQRARIDCRKVEAVRDARGRWKLIDSGFCVADYGFAEQDAKEALRVLQQYRFTDQYQLGSADNPLTYYLTNDRPPRGRPFGMKAQAFEPAGLQIRLNEGCWLLGDARQTLWNFGPHREEAEKALLALQMLKFDHLCQVGTGPMPLRFFVRDR